MKVLVKKALIYCENSPYNQQTADVLFDKGIVQKIGELDDDAKYVISGKKLILSDGFFDMRSHSKEPGNEHMDELQNLADAAAAGGFTEIMVMPNTRPIIQDKSGVNFFKNFSQNQLADINVAAAITKDCEGQDFTEMWDLHYAGALAFTDGIKSIWNSDILLKTLQYLYPKKSLLINRPEDGPLAMFGQMHEGIVSTQLGLKGIPSEAEEIMVMRDLKLLEYSGLKSSTPLLHFSCISTAAAVKHIKNAKDKGFPVSCDVAAHQLVFIDEDLRGFDSNLKVSPPFRSKKDIKALLKGLEDGTIDAIVSDHHPWDEEHKNLEFDLAEPGILGLQTVLSALLTYTDLELGLILTKLTTNPRKILKKSNPVFELQKNANVTIFDAEEKYTFKESQILSKSKNTPFVNKDLKGKIKLTIHKGQTRLF